MQRLAHRLRMLPRSGRRRGAGSPCATTIRGRAGKNAVESASARRNESTPLPPCELVCPQCDRPLTYEPSELGGVNARNSEQWDYYVCSGGCGRFSTGSVRASCAWCSPTPCSAFSSLLRNSSDNAAVRSRPRELDRVSVAPLRLLVFLPVRLRVRLRRGGARNAMSTDGGPLEIRRNDPSNGQEVQS